MDPTPGGRLTREQATMGASREKLLARSWRALRNYSDKELEEEFVWDPGVFLWTSLIGALVLVGLLHGLQAVTNNRGVFIGIVGVLPAIAIAGLLLILMVWLYWRTRLEPGKMWPYVWALLAFVATVGVCTVAFAGLTTLLWQHGVAHEAASAAPSLWSSERYYAWHLLAAVPLLSIPTTMGWSESTEFLDRTSGALLLAYTVLLIIPLLRIGFAGYQFAGNWWLARQDQDSTEAQSPASVPRMYGASSIRPGWQAVALTGLAILAILIVVIVADPSSILGRWLSPYFDRGVTVAGHHFGLSWAHIAISCLAIILLIQILGLMEDFDITSAVDASSPRAILVACVTFIGLVSIITMLFAAVTVALLQLGWGVSHPQVPAGNQLSAAIVFYVWHALNAVPGIDVPATLHWSVRYNLVDRWDAVLLLVYKVAFFGLLIIPIAWALRAFSRRATPAGPAAASAAAAFNDLLRRCSMRLVEAERRLPPPEDGWDAQLALITVDARPLIRDLHDGLPALRTLFGRGEVVDRGVEAVRAEKEWLQAINRESRRSPSWPTHAPTRDRNACRLTALDACDRFAVSAATALREAAPAVWSTPFATGRSD